MINQQILKIQEENEDVPAGEIPRTYQVSVDRYLCNQLNPGSRVKITGIYQILERNLGGLDRSMPDKGLKFHYIQMIGLGSENSYRKMTKDFTEAEINEYERFSK